jgi:hypothetical protein
MADIVAFPRPDDERVIWRCNCGCISFELRGNGDAVCLQCGVSVTGDVGDWRSQLPAAPDRPKEVEIDTVKVTDLNSSAAALRRVLGKADADRTAAVILLHHDGGVTTWGVLETEEQADWFDRRIATAKAMLVKDKG